MNATATETATTFVVLADGCTYRNDRGCFQTAGAAYDTARRMRERRTVVRRGSSITRREFRRVEVVELQTAAFRPSVLNLTQDELQALAAAWGGK